ncbi:hypothetical protein SUGI_0113710 [Cryptomeria japonica]|nr:hypothetical protein SUGI_0113710 [Cryptomeria japonica]
MASPASSLSISISSGGRPFRAMGIGSPNPNTPSSVVNRRASSGGRYKSASIEEDEEDEDDDEEEVNSEFTRSYTVQIPPTPDHNNNSSSNNCPNLSNPVSGSSTQTMEANAKEAEQQFVSSNIFTGGHNSVTRIHAMDKVIDREPSPRQGHPQMVCSLAGLICAVDGCDGKVMRDERGQGLIPCGCQFMVCRDCYMDALKNGGQCHGCKEQYRGIVGPEGQIQTSSSFEADDLPLNIAPPPMAESKPQRRLSLVRSMKGALRKSFHGNPEFDHNRWLYETKGTYGYGNALWPKEGYAGEGVNGSMNPPNFGEKARRPMSRKAKISTGILSPYRLLMVIRLLALGFFLTWRIRHPNRDAMWLWGMSVVCEIWFAFSWILDQLPKLCPINRVTDLNVLKDKFERPSLKNPRGKSDLPGIDVFVSTADPEKEPPLVTANTILSILAAEYPVEKLSCYLSDDGGSLLTFEALAEAASFARIWVPFCRKHNIEPRNPDTYFNIKRDFTKNKVRPDFVKERRRVKREYDEFKVRINSLPDSIRRRSEGYNTHEEIRAKRAHIETGGDPTEQLKVPKATWMADGAHWPGTWISASRDHSRGDHAGIIQVMLAPPSSEPLMGSSEEDNLIDTTEVDIRLPMLVYVSREKRPGCDHNKKAGAMNGLVRTSAIMSNGPFILNLDCDHYVYNSLALREAMCFMMDGGGDKICYVQFPQRFEGVDPNDRYANHNTVFFDVNMRALDGLQGPMYVGTGCVFRRIALYGFDPPRATEHGGCCGGRKKKLNLNPRGSNKSKGKVTPSLSGSSNEEEDLESQLLPKRFGNSITLSASIPIAEYQGRPLADQQGVKTGRPAGALAGPREPLDAATVAEAINVISCWYEDKTEWGQRVGWIYGSVTEDVVTGYRMHNRGWRSVYCVTKRDAFRGTAPINLTDRLHQVLRWATGSVEIFFSRNNALFASSRMKFLQRIAYINVGIYPFTSIFLMVYCFLPALSLFTGQFIVQTLNVTFLAFLLTITVTLCLLAILEIKWSGITLEEWWRNEQFWLIGGTSAHPAAVLQGLLKVVAGIDISFTLTSKSANDDTEDEFAELYVIKWSCLMIPPITIMMINIIAIAVGMSRTIYSVIPQWSKLMGGVFFSFWVLCHLYPFAKGLMGRRGKTPTIVFVWSGLLAITISLLWVSISPPNANSDLRRFQFP